MKKLTLMALLAGLNLQAQGTGGAAMGSMNTAKESNWQSWTFAATALVTATAGVLVVMIDNGKAAH